MPLHLYTPVQSAANATLCHFLSTCSISTRLNPISDVPAVTYTSVLPPDLDPISRNLRFTAEQRHALDLRLGHQEAIERVAVMVRQRVDVQGMAQRDRQHLKRLRRT